MGTESDDIPKGDSLTTDDFLFKLKEAGGIGAEEYIQVQHVLDLVPDPPTPVELLDEDDLASDSATKGVTQQSIKAYISGISGLALLDEDDMVSDSDSAGATQQSIKAFVETLDATRLALDGSDTMAGSLLLGANDILNSGLIEVGSTATVNTSDPAVSLRRALTGAGNSHGYLDSTDFGKDAATAYNAFDCYVDFGVGLALDYDHIAGYQFRPNIHTSGLTDHAYGYFSNPDIQGGTVGDVFSLYADASTSSGGSITNFYGLYVPSGISATNRYALFAPDTGISIGGRMEFTDSASIIAASLGLHSSDYVYLAGGPSGLKLTDDGLSGITVEDGGNVVFDGTAALSDRIELSGSSTIVAATLGHHSSNYVYLAGGSAGLKLTDDGLNGLTIEDGGDITVDESLGIHGVTPPAQAALIADATDAAETMALVNSLKSILVDSGFMAAS